MSSRVSSSSSSSSAAWPSARHTLFLRVHSADKLHLSTSQSSYCKIYLGETPVVSSTATMSNLFIKNEAENLPNHRTFHTKVTASKLKTTALWNEKFEIPLENMQKQILSIRVKSHHQIVSPSIGACAIALKMLKVGLTVDKNFELLKGSTPVGTIRLQMMIRDNYPDGVSEKEPKSIKRVTSDQDTKQQSLSFQKQREEEEEEKQRKQREKLEQEKLRIEKEMERLRVEEEERARRRAEEEERRRIEEETLAAEKARREKEKEEKRRRKEQEKLEEEEMIRKLAREYRKSSVDNQAIETGSRTSSRETVLTADDENDNDGNHGLSDDEGKSLHKAAKSAPELGRRRASTFRSGRRRSTLSLRDVIDEVVQDALPSDSDTSSDELDTEDELEFIRQMAKLKIKMLRQKKLRKSMQRERRESSLAGKDDKRQASTTRHKHRSSKKYRRKDSSTSSSSSSSSSSDEDARVRKSKSSKKSNKEKKERYETSSSSSSSSSSDEDARVRKSKSSKKGKREKKEKKAKSNQDDVGEIRALTPGQIAKMTGNKNNDELSAGQVFEAAMSIANVVNAVEDEETAVENIPETFEAIQNLVPIGKFIGRKIQEASAKVAQMKEKEQPTYYF